MPRTFSIARRKPNLVDLTVPRRAGVIGFRFSASASFAAAFTAFQVVRNDGLRTLRAPAAGGPRTPDISLPGSQRRGDVRFVFDPDEYTAAVAAVVDNTPFFVRIEPETSVGVFGPPEAMQLVLPYDSAPNRSVVFTGAVPAGLALANSVEIQLPMQCNDWEIRNEGAAPLMVAFERPGGEFLVQPVATITRGFEQIYTSVSQIFVRGAGAGTTMTAMFTLRNNPTSL